MILLYFLRYFAIINLNDIKKNTYFKSKDGPSVVSKYQAIWHRILKFITSTWVTFAVLVFMYALSVLLFVLVNLIEKVFVCTFNTLIAIKTLNTIELIVIYGMIMLTLISDLIANIQMLLKFKWIQYIFYSDPYYFRAQIFLFLPFMLYSLAIEFASLGLTTNYADVVKNFGTTVILNTIQVSILLVIEVLFPITITLFELARTSIRRVNVEPTGVHDYLDNPDIEALFIEFSTKEFSLENILIYKDIKAYKSSSTQSSAMLIYQTYLNGSRSVMEVNVTTQQCAPIINALREEKHDAHLFDEIEGSILANLCDTLSRFIHDPLYLTYAQSVKSRKEMIEGK
jgi:hypothetical protein